MTLAGLAVWGLANAALSLTEAPAGLAAQIFTWDAASVKWSDVAGLSLLAGLAGSAALVAGAGLLAGSSRTEPLRWLGAHSIVVYLAFFLPMAVARTLLIKLGIVADVGIMSLLTWIAAVTGPVVLYGLVQWTGWGRFLFERPAWARLEGRGPAPAERLVAGE